MKRIISGILFAILPVHVWAGPITIADFNSPVIEEFEGLSGNINDPLVLNNVTYTTNNGIIRQFLNTDAFANCFDGCITTDTEFGFIDAVFDQAFYRVGGFLGAFQQPNSASASFYDSLDNLLGTVSFTGLSAGNEFVGFESFQGIKRVRFTDTAQNGAVLSLDRLHRELPEPSMIALMGLGLLGLSFARRRKA